MSQEPEDDKKKGEDEEKLAEGTLISHLLELRDRIIRAMIAVGIAAIPCVLYSNDIFTYISKPLRAKLPPGSAVVATGVWSPFTTPFKLSFFVALFIAMPYVLYQVWAFVAPGLYRHEKRFAIPLLVSAILLFYVGMGFAYEIVFPVMFQFFVNTMPEDVKMMTDINQYLDFVLTMFFCFGLAFEVPVAVMLLVLMEVVRVEKLQEHRKYVLLGIFILAACITPPDPISQCSLAIPMYLLYEGGLIMSRYLLRMKRDATTKAAKA
jgi:sec-independent protein translocase protein TatC